MSGCPSPLKSPGPGERPPRLLRPRPADPVADASYGETEPPAAVPGAPTAMPGRPSPFWSPTPATDVPASSPAARPSMRDPGARVQPEPTESAARTRPERLAPAPAAAKIASARKCRGHASAAFFSTFVSLFSELFSDFSPPPSFDGSFFFEPRP